MKLVIFYTQRLPTLSPPPRAAQPPVNSILDCCVLWLRHNLHRRLEVQSYTYVWYCSIALFLKELRNCIWICYRTVWFLQHRRLRLGKLYILSIRFIGYLRGEDYDWRELWNSVIGLMNFLVSKIETLHTTGGIELLASEVFDHLSRNADSTI